MDTLFNDIQRAKEQAETEAELKAIAERPSIKGKRAPLTPAELDAKLDERLANGWR